MKRYIAGLMVLLVLGGCTYTAELANDQVALLASEQDIETINGRINHELMFESLSELDHDALFVGTYCSAHTVKNSLSGYVKAYLDGVNEFSKNIPTQGLSSNSKVELSTKSTRTIVKCLGSGTFGMRCSASVSVEIDAVMGDSAITLESKASSKTATAISCGKVGDAISLANQKVSKDIASGLVAFISEK